MYADHDYYISEYLMGKKPAVPEEEFAFFEKQARKVIDVHTFGRMTANPGLICEEVKDCTCAITELLYKADSVSDQAFNNGAPGPLVSYSNDGESGSFDLKESIYTESGKNAKAKQLIYQYLGNTGLLYAGVR